MPTRSTSHPQDAAALVALAFLALTHAVAGTPCQGQARSTGLRTDGQLRTTRVAPRSLDAGQVTHDRYGFVFRERTVELQEPLEVTLAGKVAGTYTGEAVRERSATIPRGARVTSYLIHFEPKAESGAKKRRLQGAVAFPGEIIGLAGTWKHLDQTNAIFGRSGTQYPKLTAKESFEFDSGDSVTIDAQRRVVRIDWWAAGGGSDHVRVLVRQ